VLGGCHPLPAGEVVDLIAPRRIALHPDGQHAYVFDEGLMALVLVDLTSGEARVVSSDEVGTGPAFQYPHGSGLAYDAHRGRIIVADMVNLLAVHPVTGRRTVVSPSGPSEYLEGGFFAPVDVALFADGQRALVASEGDHSLYEVDLVTGARSRIAGLDLGEGDALTYHGGVVLDEANHRAIVWSQGFEYAFPALYAVDLDTGDRTFLYVRFMCPDEYGWCDWWEGDFAFDPASGLAWTSAEGGVWEIDAATGDAAPLSGGTPGGELYGEGPATLLPMDIAYDAAGGRLVLVGGWQNPPRTDHEPYVATVDLETGRREIVYPPSDETDEPAP
jgi:hypothetical protein